MVWTSKIDINTCCTNKLYYLSLSCHQRLTRAKNVHPATRYNSNTLKVYPAKLDRLSGLGVWTLQRVIQKMLLFTCSKDWNEKQTCLPVDMQLKGSHIYVSWKTKVVYFAKWKICFDNIIKRKRKQTNKQKTNKQTNKQKLLPNDYLFYYDNAIHVYSDQK